MTTTAEHPPENSDSAPDLEAKLARMYEITQIKEQLEEERVELRELLAEELDGSRYFIDPITGEKRYGFVIQPEPIEVDLDKLQRLAPEVYDEVLKDPAPPALDKAKFKKAVETQRLSTEVFVQVAKKTKGTASVRFGNPYAPPPKY